MEELCQLELTESYGGALSAGTQCISWKSSVSWNSLNLMEELCQLELTD
jgi:hypothetical protein